MEIVSFLVDFLKVQESGVFLELLYVYFLEIRFRIQVGFDIWFFEVIFLLKWDGFFIYQYWERSCSLYFLNKGVGNRVKVQFVSEGCAFIRNSSQLCIGDWGWKSVRRAVDFGLYGRDKVIDFIVGFIFFSQKGIICWRLNSLFK